MHLFKKSIGLFAVLCAMPTAFAATETSRATTPTGRLAVVTAASRMPTLAVSLGISGGTTSAATGTTTSAALLADKECIDAYTECAKGADVCGENFEECTTKVLFHGKMPNCLSTLSQCSSTGVNSLFGTTNIAALANVAAKNSYGEVTDYTYPTDGSVMGQMITAAAITNQYDTSTCVRRYTSCLKKESVCGADFELCTTDKEFRKQRVFCDSTLARCQGEGVTELLGSSTRTANPTKNSRVGEMITEGAALAAVNAVSTCYKTVDQCILNACGANPYKCYENSNQSVVDLVEAINNGTPITTELVESIVSKSTIAAYIKGACLDTIGSSKYCYATFIGNGQMPTNAQLRDEDNQEEIFDEAYASRMNMAMKAKIADLVDKFDTKAKQRCTDTIKSCAMRTCGGGVGAACYAAVFGNKDKSINGSATYEEIKTGCASIVNTDANCKYAAANPNSTGSYTYTYINKDAFDVLFPEYDDGAENDAIGVVSTLNASLSANYNDAAIAQMKKQCQNVATSCVRSLCGTDYTNCYRNRTDIYSSLTQSGDAKYDKSMNKVGGVLDYTIVLGLCLDTVKNASVCEEHLAIEANKIKMAGTGKSSWGTDSVRGDWIDAGAATRIESQTDVVPLTDAYGNKLCRTQDGDEGICDTVSGDGKVYDIPETVEYTTFVQSQAASTLFKDLIYDIEKEAQAVYNSKLTREQNMCMSSNASGVMGKNDTGSTFMWVKLKGDRVPKDYNVNGLKQTAFAASNDLYGSFCRVRVTLQSDDKKIQEEMKGKNWTTAYFAVGDSFTCGSWIPERDLENIANTVADEATESMKKGQDRTAFWTTLLGAVGGTAGGVALGEGIRNGSVLGGLTGRNPGAQQANSLQIAKNKCEKAIKKFQDETKYSKIKTDANEVILAATGLGVSTTDFQNAVNGIKPVSDNGTEIISFCENYAKSNNIGYSGQCSCDTLIVEDVLADGTKRKNEAETKKAQEQCNRSKPNDLIVAGSKTSADTEAWKLLAGCQSSTAEQKNKNAGWITGVTAVTLGAAGGALAYKATRDVQQSNLDAAQKAAYEEWMNNVGRHITCYIGGDEAGEYGDIISTSLE